MISNTATWKPKQVAWKSICATKKTNGCLNHSDVFYYAALPEAKVEAKVLNFKHLIVLILDDHHTLSYMNLQFLLVLNQYF